MNNITISIISIIAVIALIVIYQGLFSPFARLHRAFNRFAIRGFMYLDSHSDIWKYQVMTSFADNRGYKISLPRYKDKEVYIKYVEGGSTKKAMREFVAYLLKMD